MSSLKFKYSSLVQSVVATASATCGGYSEQVSRCRNTTGIEQLESAMNTSMLQTSPPQMSDIVAFGSLYKPKRNYIYSSLAQSVEHSAVNRVVVGSSPTGGAKRMRCPTGHLILFVCATK